MNPYLPLHIYTADAEPKVFGDRVYIYGSNDIFGGDYCSDCYHVYSAPVDDLTQWTDHGISFASTGSHVQDGIADGVPWSDAVLYAPDVVEKDGTYYLYFCLSDRSEGVAVSDKPEGPFTDTKRITMGGEPIHGIDPSVLADDDGSVWYTWGQGDMKMARLCADMATLDPDTYVDKVITRDADGHGFHEGSSLRKIGKKYCIIYASEYQNPQKPFGGAPTKLDYAVSDCVTGPYRRRGTVIDNAGIDPKTWNNHGSIVQIGGQWYVFYHGSTNSTEFARRARAEKINVDENARIEQAEMTSQGFRDVLDPYQKILAAYAYSLGNGAYLTERKHMESTEFPIIDIKNGSFAGYRYFEFGQVQEEQTFRLEYYPKSGGRLEIHLDTVDGPLVGDMELAGEGKGFLLTQDCDLTRPVSGRHGVCLVFRADHAQEICEVVSFAFIREETARNNRCSNC